MVDELGPSHGGIKPCISEEEWRILREGTVSTAFADHGSFRTPSGKMMIYNENLEEAMPRYIKAMGEHTPLRLVAVPSAYAEFGLCGQGGLKLRQRPYDADAPSKRRGGEKNRGRQSRYSLQ